MASGSRVLCLGPLVVSVIHGKNIDAVFALSARPGVLLYCLSMKASSLARVSDVASVGSVSQAVSC